MNARQVRALHDLVRKAEPLGIEPDIDTDDKLIHVTMEVAHGVDDGNTYEVKLWMRYTLLYFPDWFYIRGDGVVYTHNAERDSCHEVQGVRWERRVDHGWRLAATVGGAL